MQHPYAELIGLRIAEQRPGFSRCELAIEDKHLNPLRVVHGGVLYALADTGMGAALYPTLAHEEICATIQIVMNYFKPVRAGAIICASELINRGKTVAHIESRLYVDDALVAAANGNFSIFKPSRSAS